MHSLVSSIEQVPPSSLIAHPRNPRRGRVDLIKDSLAENAQYVPLVVQLSTRHVLKGNHTLKAAIELGWPTVSVTFVDVDDARALKILLNDNTTSDASTFDDEALLAALEALGGDFTGSGHDLDDLTDLRAMASMDTEGLLWEPEADMVSVPDAPAAPKAAAAPKAEPESVLTVAMDYDRREQAREMISRLRHHWDPDMTDGDVVYEALHRASRGVA